jgi:peptide/nickel transport system substrate-binding protein
MRTGSISLQNVSQSIWGEGNLIQQCEDEPSELCPSIAESWGSNADNTVWTFEIRDGVFWHDGVEFSAEDAKFWFDLASFGVTVGDAVRRPSNWAWPIFVDHTEVVGGNTLQVTLKKPVAIFDTMLAVYNQQIAHPRHLMQPLIDAGDVNVAPIDVGFVGLGPFMVEKYQQGSIISVRKFDKYWKKGPDGEQLPYMDGIDFFIITDASAMDAQYRANNLDATARGGGFILTPEREQAILGSSVGDETFIALMGQSSFLAIAFNSLREPFNDIRLRRAVHLWLDREDLIQVTFGGFAKPTGMFDPPFSNPDILDRPGWSQETKAQDRERAKELLAEAGYPDGIEVPMMCRRAWTAYCEAVSSQLSELGMDAPLEIVDDATRADRFLAANFDITITGPTVANPESYIIRPHSGSPNSEVKHEDPKVNEFYDRLDTATSLDQRIAISREWEQYMGIDMVYAAWMYQQVAHQAYRTHVRGVPVPADNYRRQLTYDTTWLDQ